MSVQKLLLPLAIALIATTAVAQEKADQQDARQKFSYALGMEMGSGFRKQALDLDTAALAKGMADAFNGSTTAMTEDEMRAVLSKAQEEYKAKQVALRAQQAETARKEGEEFLAANKSKPGVITLPSGLQYKVLKNGTGEKPDGDDTVVCNYRGTLLDGTEFDSSARHNGPSTFPIDGTIKGWKEALQLMPVGSKWQLYVPSYLAYGPLGAGQKIPPNATLIFDVDLLSVKDDKEGQKRERE